MLAPCRTGRTPKALTGVPHCVAGPTRLLPAAWNAGINEKEAAAHPLPRCPKEQKMFCTHHFSKELQTWVEAERKNSSIDPEVWALNVRVLAGWEAPAEFLAESIAARQRDQNYVGAEGKRLLQRYAHLEAGCWMMWGEALVDRPLVPYAKPMCPRQGADGKIIKYENPPRVAGYPVLPLLPGRTWAEVLADPRVPVAIVEGAKKAMALISHGLVAVAIRGVTMWHAGGERDPWPELALLARGGRTIYLFPDQDVKPRSRADVLSQNTKLGRALERLGADVRVVLWDPALGKGVDDVLATRGGAWLEEALADAVPLRRLSRNAVLAKARLLLSKNTLEPTVVQPGGYVGTVQAPRGGLLWLDAPMGSGKTTALGRTAREWIARGGQVLVLSPLNSLGRQTAERFGLPHIHDYSPAQAKLLQADVTARGGLVACLNSAERIAAALNPGKELLVIIDEANQVLADAASGGTLRDQWSAKLAIIQELLRRAVSVIAAEAGIWAETVDLLAEIRGRCPVVGYRVDGKPAPWQTTVYSGTPAAWRAEVAARLLQGQRLLLVTTSQREGRRWHRWATAHGIPTERIDGETVGEYAAFFRDPNAWMASTPHQLLILSPTAKTGVSLETGGYDAVVGAFPTLDTTTCMQLLGRYRPPVPRVVWRPEFIQPEPDEEYNTQKVWGFLAQELAVYGETLDAAGPWTRFYVAIGRRRWAQKVAANASLVWALEAAGHVCTPGQAEPDAGLTQEFRAIDAELRAEDAAVGASLSVDPELHTVEWARATLEGLDASLTDRRRAQKVLLRHEFPGADWNDPALWMAAIHDKRPLRRKAQRWVGGPYAKARLRNDNWARQMLQQDPCPAHLVRRDVFDWALAQRFRPLLRPILEAGIVHPDGEAERRVVDLALQMRDEIRRYWRLEISEEHSTTATVCKILRKFGFLVVRSHCVRTASGGRGWVYNIALPYGWLELTTAFHRHLEEAGYVADEPFWIPDHLPVVDAPTAQPPPP